MTGTAGVPPRDDPLLDARADDDQFDLTLRPRTLADYVGQQQVRENLSILLEAARPSSTSCCAARLDSGRQRSPTSSPTS